MSTRDKAIILKVTRKEHAGLKRGASDVGSSLSDYVRALVGLEPIHQSAVGAIRGETASSVPSTRRGE